MNFLQKTVTSIALAIATVATPVQASTYHAEHVRLAEAVEMVGVDFQLNPFQCYLSENNNVMGWYHGAGGVLVVCQQNAYSNYEVEWTEEDYDTLRHEVHHLVQDCVDGRLQGRLDSVYDDPIELAKDVLGHRGVLMVINGYSDMPNHRQVMELEAFSVASLNNPAEQLRDIYTYCM